MTTALFLKTGTIWRQPELGSVCFSSLGAISAASSKFVPKHVPASSEDISTLSDFVREASPGLLLLTGAGISTESGVPDYRSAEVGLFARSNRKPVQHSVYMRSPDARKSFWSRSFVGWPRWSALTPNAAHRALAEWERRGVVAHVVTQNVDQLHYKAGSQKVIELHGTNSRVACTSCSYSITRQAFQHVLTECNPEIAVSVAETESIRPDGDVDIPQVRNCTNMHSIECNSAKPLTCRATWIDLSFRVVLDATREF
jgi:NAD-dependent deacetylase sirtuin 4